MHLHFDRASGIFFSIIGLVVVLCAVAVLLANQPRWHPRAVKPAALDVLAANENADFQSTLDEITSVVRSESATPTLPPVDNSAPKPEATRLYNNLLDNLLSSLHYYYRLSDSAAPSQYVVSWDAGTGLRSVGEARLFALETDVAYLLTLEIYRKLHAKAIFDQDLEYAKNRVKAIFDEDWHTTQNWPLGAYFDLVQLYDVTGDKQCLDWAERFGVGSGPNDADTPLTKSKQLAYTFQGNHPRVGTPIYFLQAALLASYGKRKDPGMIDPARYLFQGLRDTLFDNRYNMLLKQVSIATTGSQTRNLNQVYDTLEQLTAIRAIISYGRDSGDSEALSLARTLFKGVYETGSPLLMKPPEGLSANTYFGLYTAYDADREALRSDPNEETIVQVLLFETAVLLNQVTRGEYRKEVDFLSQWMEDAGPLYRQSVNGYYTTYGKGWADPDSPAVSAKAAIWMARGLAEDELYKFQSARALTEGSQPPVQ